MFTTSILFVHVLTVSREAAGISIFVGSVDSYLCPVCGYYGLPEKNRSFMVCKVLDLRCEVGRE